jgi:two-component system, OmpR family, copper resistance phosphate regulon response regulator CusR
MSRILIAEDERRIASFLEKGLAANGYTTEIVRTGEDVIRLARQKSFDLLILDIGLPQKDGFEVLRQLRAERIDLRVLILTARDDPADTVEGLDSGADDYVTKPFRFDELLARIRVQLREDRTSAPTALTVSDLSLDLRTRQVHVEGKAVELSAREFALAELFFRHPGQVLSREQILSHVWGYDFDPGSNVVDVYVGYLRKKIGSHRISAVRRMGYRLEKNA